MRIPSLLQRGNKVQPVNKVAHTNFLNSQQKQPNQKQIAALFKNPKKNG